MPNIPTHESEFVDATCPICKGSCKSYPPGGDYYVLDCDNCNGPYKITGRAVAVLEYPDNREVAVKKMIKILQGWDRTRQWTWEHLDRQIPIVGTEIGFILKFHGHKSVAIPTSPDIRV